MTTIGIGWGLDYNKKYNRVHEKKWKCPISAKTRKRRELKMFMMGIEDVYGYWINIFNSHHVNMMGIEDVYSISSKPLRGTEKSFFSFSFCPYSFFLFSFCPSVGRLGLSSPRTGTITFPIMIWKEKIVNFNLLHRIIRDLGQNIKRGVGVLHRFFPFSVSLFSVRGMWAEVSQNSSLHYRNFLLLCRGKARVTSLIHWVDRGTSLNRECLLWRHKVRANE